LQAIIQVAARAVNQDMLDEFTARNNAALRELTEKHGVQIRKLPDDVLAALRTASDQVISETIANDTFAQQVYASFKAFSQDVIPYTNISERAFLEARQAP
jgi:TRAP-type mannitol/chloroaromatic compound transport system substrate-binding protein